MSESVSHLRFRRRHTEGESVGMEGTFLVVGGPEWRHQASLCIFRDRGVISGGEWVIIQASSPREKLQWSE